MIKKLIPAAVLLSLFGAAQAQVTLYGLVNLSYGKNEIGVPSETNATFHSGGDDLSSQGNSATGNFVCCGCNDRAGCRKYSQSIQR